MSGPSALKEIMERASRGVTLRRRLPSDFGSASIYVTPESMLRFWRPSLQKVDPPLFAAAQKFVKPGDVVWDIGANVGLFSFAASWMSGTRGCVFSFEPDAWLASMIQHSAAKLPGGYAPVNVVGLGLSDCVDLARLFVGKKGRAANHLDGILARYEGRGATLVPTVTLDWLCERLPAPAVLKIDVEGAEAGVLKGAAQLLREYHPITLCEVAEHNCDLVSSILHDCGYSLFEHDGYSPVQRAPFNTVAIPPRCIHT